MLRLISRRGIINLKENENYTGERGTMETGRLVTACNKLMIEIFLED